MTFTVTYTPVDISRGAVRLLYEGEVYTPEPLGCKIVSCFGSSDKLHVPAPDGSELSEFLAEIPERAQS